MNTADNYQQIIRLIAQEILGGIEREEDKALLKAWREASAANEQLYQRLVQEDNYRRHEAARAAIDTKRYWKRFEAKTKSRKSILAYWMYATAAAAAVIAGLFLLRPAVPVPGTATETVANTPIQPGTSKAVLVLSDGRNIDLTDDKNQKMKIQGLEINHQKIEVKDTSRKEKTGEPLGRNKIITPRGGEYQLVLADGTQVFINAESQLEFPTKFTAEKREVWLEGEAYFKVASNSECPFIVKTAGMDILVTGTEFNLKAYRNEKTAQATLVKGEVKVRSGNSFYQLQPSQQAELNVESHQLTVKDVDVSPYVGWQKGWFIFKGDRLEDIMVVLGRWYDFEVVYEAEELKDIAFVGKLKRTESIDPILDVLRTTQKIKVRIKDKQIIFSKK